MINFRRLKGEAGLRSCPVIEAMDKQKSQPSPKKLKKYAGSWSAALLALIFTCLFPCVFLYAQNIGEAHARDMLFFLKIFLLTAAAGFVLALALFRNVSRAGFMTCVGMLVVINFSMAAEFLQEKLGLRPILFLILLCILFTLLAILLLRKKPDLTVGCVLIAIAFGAMCGINLGTAEVTVLLSGSGNSQALEQTTEQQELPAFSGEKRNVYYLLFDEYPGSENLEHYYGTDNEEFLTALEELGFAVSRTSRNTESCWTDTLVPNLLNLSYVADDSMSVLSRRAFLEAPYLYRLFRANGYSINLINHRAYLSTEGVTELTEDQTEDTISQYLLDNSIFCRIDPIDAKIEKQLWRNYRDRYQGPIENCLTALQNCRSAAGESGTLTVSYIQCPHAPFVFAADGSIVETIARWNWKDDSYYLGQLSYLNDLLLPVIRSIRETDPDAVVILLSDHGARRPVHMVSQYGGPEYDAAEETPYMQSVLCCVYVPEGNPEIEGDTGINAVRKTLDAAFGTALGTIQAPEGYVIDSTETAE